MSCHIILKERDFWYNIYAKKCYAKWGETVMLTKEREQVSECTIDSALIGKRIKTARKSIKMTQEQLAELCDCTPTHICNIENGKIGISLELLFKMSKLLNKSMDYFVMDSPGANPQIKINTTIAPKLSQCDQNMLTMVDGFLDDLLTYLKTVESEIEEAKKDHEEY